MLKDRLRRWEQDKNVKPHEMEAIIRRLSLRDSAQKLSAVRVRGKPVPMAKVVRYRKRKTVAPHDVARIRSFVRARTPPGIEVYTPPATPLTLPDALRVPEEIMKYIGDYIPAAFETEIWISVGECKPLKGQREGSETADLNDLLNNALHCFKCDEPRRAEHLLTLAHRRTESIIRAQEDDLTSWFLFSVCRYASAGLLEWILPIIDQFSMMASKVLNPTHPLARICMLILSYLKGPGTSELSPAITTILKSDVDGFRAALGPLHRSTILHHTLYSICEATTSDRRADIADLREIVRRCDVDYRGPWDERSFQSRLNLINGLCQNQSPHWQAAADVAAEAIEMIQKRRLQSDQVAIYRRYCHFWLGRCQMKLGRVGSGESHYKKAIDIAIQTWGPLHEQTLSLQDQLKSDLRQQRRTETVNEIGPQIEAAVDNTSEATCDDAKV